MQPILKIDLATGLTAEYHIPEKWQNDFLGGASLAARILYAALTKDLVPLSPEAPLLFLTGPLTGTSGPTTGRFASCGKGPATGLGAESNIGGFWGPELRAAGGAWILVEQGQPKGHRPRPRQYAVRDQTFAHEGAPAHRGRRSGAVFSGRG